MSASKFVYVTYIRTTREKLWDALRLPEFTKLYWKGVVHESEWKAGASWRMMYSDGKVTDAGEVVEFDPPKRLVLSWRNEFRPELKDEGFSRATFELEQMGKAVKLTVTHEIDRKDSKFVAAVSTGWPAILSSLKTLLETGVPFEESEIWPKRAG